MALHPALALQKAVVAALRADQQLRDLLGGPRVHDRPPRRAEPPYVTIGDIETRAWNTFTSRGHEHLLTLHAFSPQRGRRETYLVLARLDELLDGADLALQDHHLVNLRSIFWTALPHRDGRLYRGILRLRATTHPLS